jgi:hypothetical protein
MPRRAWESHPGTAPPTPRRCATLCGMVSSLPVALYHPLPYDRCTAPSKKDCRTLEEKTHDYSTPARGCAVTSGQWKKSPPSPSALCDHPTLWKYAATRHRHTVHCAPYDSTSTTPPSPHTGSPLTGDLYAATLEAAPGRAQDVP